jgi:hypothetical protein
MYDTLTAVPILCNNVFQQRGTVPTVGSLLYDTLSVTKLDSVMIG